MNTKDLFSQHAGDYSTYRPDYPIELFEFIFNQVKNFESAWDCGTGNGQAAKVLATRFKQVYATDISDKQMANASGPLPNIQYSVTAAEQTNFPDNQFDLITVAQAIHWFKFDLFYNEVKRLAKRDAILAVWGYGLLNINPDFDEALIKFYKEVIDPYWDPERKYIDERYQTIPFPFKSIPAPSFTFYKMWTNDQLSGYLTTWSSVQKFIHANGDNPIEGFMSQNRHFLSNDLNKVVFPLFLRIGKVNP